MPNANPEWPSFSIADKNIIFINTNWHNQKELLFQTAHEIGHALNHDHGVQYYSSPSNKSKIEAGANSTAIDLLIDYYQNETNSKPINSVQFMELFGIPYNLEYQVAKKLFK